MTDINKLAERLRELSQAASDGRWSEFSVLCGNADHVLQTAANELQRLESALREHMQLTRDAIEQCDVLRARVAELEQQPIQWRPIAEAPKDKDVFLWSRHLGDAFSGSWHSKFGWVDSQYNKLPNVTHFAEIVGPNGES